MLNLRRDSLRLALNQSGLNEEPPPSDLEGIDLEMANRLYLTHADKLNTVEINNGKTILFWNSSKIRILRSVRSVDGAGWRHSGYYQT